MTIPATEGKDNITGSPGDDMISGLGGNDVLSGGDGNDTLDGGANDDILNGDAGNDTLLAGDNSDSAHGGSGDDTIFGGGGNDYLEGGPGNDFIDGGDGKDTAAFAGLLSAYRIVYAGANVLVTHLASGEVDTLVNIETLAFQDVSVSVVRGTDAPELLTGTTKDDQIFGLGGDDTLVGGDGNDYLDGGTGADRMEGGAGNDTFVVDDPGDQTIELAGQGTADRVLARIEDVVLAPEIEELDLDTGVARGTGNGKDNILRGNAGDNILDGGLGADRMEGGRGADTYFVDNVDDLVVEADNEPNDDGPQGTQPLDLGSTIDKVVASVSYSLGAFVENLELRGGAGALNGSGNELDNVLVGNDGANILSGLGGNDRLSGGGGNDSIDGGQGSDTVVYAGARADYAIAWSKATQLFTVVSAADGRDEVRNVERFEFADGSYAATVFQDETAPTVLSFQPADEATGASASRNIVLTFSEAVQRGSGSIVLRTAAGSVVESFNAATSSKLAFAGTKLSIDPSADLAFDTGYRLDIAAGSVLDAAGNAYAGTTSYNFRTGGPPAVVNGSAGADALVGGSGDDQLFGLGGDDTLNPGAGSNQLDGGAGLDTALYAGARAAHTLSAAGGGQWLLEKPDASGEDSLAGVERLSFTDGKLALDVDGHAGGAALLIGAALGRPFLHNESLVGVVLSLFDAGLTLPVLCDVLVGNGIMAQLGAGPDNTAFVTRVLTNVLGGVVPDAGTVGVLQSLIDQGALTQGQFLAVAAGHALNQANVDLVGLAQTGLEYV